MKRTYSPILRILWHVFHVNMWPCFLEFTYITVPTSQHTLNLPSSGWTWYVGLDIDLGFKIMAWKGNQWIAVLSNGKDTCGWKEKFGGKETKPGTAQSVHVVTLKNWGRGDSSFLRTFLITCGAISLNVYTGNIKWLTIYNTLIPWCFGPLRPLVPFMTYAHSSVLFALCLFGLYPLTFTSSNSLFVSFSQCDPALPLSSLQPTSKKCLNHLIDSLLSHVPPTPTFLV
jgi:hypothetical protein